MELESNFEFISPDAIRVKGTRVAIEIIIEDYLNGYSPEEIVARYRSLSLKQVYATITYYLFNQEKLDAYVEEGHRRVEQAWREQRRNPSPVRKRLLEIKAAREADQRKESAP